MENSIRLLELKIKELDHKIEEVQRRLPAHSVKPPIMMELLELEDERDAVFRELERRKQAKTK